MKKNDQDKNNRIAFVKLAIDDPKQAEKVMMKHARQIGRAKGTQDIIRILSETLYLSEQTLYKDYSK